MILQLLEKIKKNSAAYFFVRNASLSDAGTGVANTAEEHFVGVFVGVFGRKSAHDRI